MMYKNARVNRLKRAWLLMRALQAARAGKTVAGESRCRQSVSQAQEYEEYLYACCMRHTPKQTAWSHDSSGIVVDEHLRRHVFLLTSMSPRNSTAGGGPAHMLRPCRRMKSVHPTDRDMTPTTRLTHCKTCSAAGTGNR